MLNFKKDGIFTRSRMRKDETPKPVGGVIAVWGSPGCGKTTVAAKLAQYIANQKQDVILLLCDVTAPMLPCICIPSDLECESIPNNSAGLRSLGSILAATHVSESLIKQNCVTHKKLKHLSLIGMLKGENEYSYPPYTQQQAKELIGSLRKIAPFVIIDCGSYIASDILSAVALMEADTVLRLTGCNLKSISYLSSQMPLLKAQKWDEEKQYKAASNIKVEEGTENLEKVLGTITFKIPHSAELEAQGLAGNLFAELTLKDSRGFRREIQKICREVCSIE